MDIVWKDGKLTDASISLNKGATYVLRAGMLLMITVDGKKLETTQVEEGVISLPTESSGEYQVLPKYR